MGAEDLDAWGTRLLVCLGHMLDGGTDAAHMLDHLPRTAMSMRIPTGAFATRAAACSVTLRRPITRLRCLGL
jgi:hypothetical protein